MLTCASWVKQGIAKEVPDKVELSKEDIEQLMNETKERVRNDEQQLNQAEGEETKESLNLKNDEENDELTEYDFDNYDANDDEGEIMSGAGMAGLTYFTSNEDDPYITMKNIEDEDKDDYIIKPTDNLIVTGKMEEEYCNLEIHVYNNEEGSLYVHHDVMLESVPLALEWMSFDPSTPTKTGNLVAVGTMDPHIEVWDLDLVDTMEPVFTLGKKTKKKKKKASATNTQSHMDAVLGLSWNRNARHVLASGSADKTVMLWDMNESKCIHALRHHRDKVQCVQFHPYEAQSLLTGSFDTTAQVLDCRSPEACAKSWKLDGEIEQVVWNHLSPFYFLVSTETGNVYYCDVRSDSPTFQISAHDSAVTGMALSSQVAGCLVTASSDKTVKVWDIKDGKPACVMSKDMKMGRIHYACSCPDLAYTFCFGGEKDGVRVLDLLETAAGREHFGNAAKFTTISQQNVSSEADEKNGHEPKAMDTDVAENAFASLSLHAEADNKPKEIVKKKRKKKNKK